MAGTGFETSRRAACWKPAAAGLAFACVMGLALFVRLHRIGEEGFHWDEALTLRAFFGLYQNGFADAFRESRAIDPPMTPVYFVLQYAWGWTAGFTMPGMHLLSVLFSAATFVAVFLVGQKLRGTWTGLWAMFLLAASPIHVYYSLEIRNYSLTALLGVLSLLTLLRAVENPTRSSWAVNFAVDVLLAMSHLFANLLFVPQAIFLLVCHRRRAVLLPWGVSHVVVAAVVAAWLGTCDFTAMRKAASYMGPLTWEGGHDMLAALAGASYEWVGPVMGSTGSVGAIVIALFLLGLFALLAERLVFRKAFAGGADRGGPLGEAHGVLLIVLTVLVPPALLAAITLIHTHCFLARYVICSAVAVPILLACAVTMLRSATVRVVLAAALIVVNVSLLDQMVRAGSQRSGWLETRRFLAEGVKENDYFVIFSEGGGFSSMFEMLLPVSPKKTVRKKTWSPSDLEELAAWHARGIRVWGATGIDEVANAEFETLLGVYNLPFSKHVLKPNCHVLYCIPAGAGAFVAHGDSVIHVPVGSGRLRGWFAVDPDCAGTGMGMTQLASAEHPYAPIFMRPSLCLQSVTDGRSGEEWLSWDAAHGVPMEVRLPSPACAEVRWPISALANRLECRMRHVFSGKTAVDMLFEVTQGSIVNSQSPLVFTWVANVRGACTPGIHFPGVRDGLEGWVSFGESAGERGAVAGLGAPGQEWGQEGIPVGLRPVQNICFSEPVYYGLVDGDQNDVTDGDVMAFILMFEHPEDTRFVLRDGENDTRNSEWDWQYVVRAPEAGRTYSQRVRMVYKQFLGREDVLAEYRAWRDAPPSMDGPAGEACVFPLAIPGPDGEESDFTAPLEGLAELDPQKALDAYVALLEVPLYRRAAADGIDACYMRFGDHAGLAAQWEFIAARETLDVLAWSRLGAASHRMGETEKAAKAFVCGLERDTSNQECLIGLTAVRFDENNLGEALRLAGMAAVQNPELAKQAADLCAAAARARLAAGDAAAAEIACRAAMQFAPHDASTKMLLGRLLADRGQIEDALALFGEVVAADTNMIGRVGDACSAISGICSKAGNVPRAAALLRSAIVCPSGEPNCRMALGQALEAARDDEGALAEYLTAMAASPESQAASERIDLLFKRRGDNSARVGAWRRLADACPGAVLPRVRLCLALEIVGDLDGAEAVCHMALRQDPENGPAKIQLGKLRALRSDIKGGLALIKTATLARLDLAEQAAEACAAVARALLEAGDSAGADAVLRGARLLVPDTCPYAAARAAILETLGDMSGAEAVYREALKCDPGDFPAKIHLGALLAARGDAEGGRRLIEEAVSAVPGGAGLAADACAAAARRCVQAGDAPGAVAAFRRALSLTPNVLGYRAELAAALEATGDSVAALKEYRTVVEAAPESPKSSARIDAILDGRGDRAARTEQWKRVAASHPDAAVPQLHLGLALEASGDSPGARSAFEKALKTNPALAEARNALGRLDNAAGNGKQ